MKKSHIFSVLKVEGLHGDLSLAGCYITIDGRLYDVLTPLSSHIQENLLELPKEGNLRLIMKTMSQGDDILASVSIPVQLLPETGLQWLPLFEKLDEDKVEQIHENVGFPRVLVSLSNLRILSPVQELDEMSTFNEAEFKQDLEENLPHLSSFSTALDMLRGEDCADEKVMLRTINELQDHIRQLQSSHAERENAMKMKILELEQNLHEEKWKFKHELGKIIHQTKHIEDEKAFSYEKMKIQLKKSNIIRDDLQKQLRSLQDYFKTESDYRKELEYKVDSITSKHTEEVKILHAHNSELRNLLQNADNANHGLNQEIHKLKLQLNQLVQLNSDMETRFAHQEIKATQVSFMGSKILGLEVLLKEANEARNELHNVVMEIEEDRNPNTASGTTEELISENRQLKESIREKDFMIQRFNSSMGKDETNELKSELKDYKQRLARAQEEVQDYQKVLKFKQEEITLMSEEYEKLKQSNEAYLKDKASAEAMYKDLKSKLETFKSSKLKTEESEDIDVLISEYFKSKNLENIVTKVGDGVYSIFNKKVSIAIKSQIIVRVGGGYMNIEEFLNKHYLETPKSTDGSKTSSKVNSPSYASMSPFSKPRHRRNSSMISSHDLSAELESFTFDKRPEPAKVAPRTLPDDENVQPVDFEKLNIASYENTPKNKLSKTTLLSKNKRGDSSSRIHKNPLKERNFTPMRLSSGSKKPSFK
jgi:chromosome segregation ATPase